MEPLFLKSSSALEIIWQYRVFFYKCQFYCMEAPLEAAMVLISWFTGISGNGYTLSVVFLKTSLANRNTADTTMGSWKWSSPLLVFNNFQ